MKFRIFNGTPHSINIVWNENATFIAAQRKYVVDGEAETFDVIPSNNAPLNAVFAIEKCEPVNGIATQRKAVKAIDPLPEGYDFYLVSAMYVAAARELGRDTSKLLTVGDPVFKIEGDGRMSVIGTLSLNRN